MPDFRGGEAVLQVHLLKEKRVCNQSNEAFGCFYTQPVWLSHLLPFI